MKPVFIDNRDGNTLAQAITEYLSALRGQDNSPEELCITSAYFNPQGLQLLAKEAKYIGHIKLLLGAEPTPEALLPRRKPTDPPEPALTHRRVKHALEKTEERLKEDRNFLPFDLDIDKAILTLLEFLRSGHIEVRRYESHFLHAKAYLFCGQHKGFIIGSSNLTRAGLHTNRELNLGHNDEELVNNLTEWYNRHWQEAVPYDLISLYEEMFTKYPPYLIYLKVLWHLYHGELEEEEQESGYIPITTFQKHGVWRARNILRKYGGVLIADGVGLGKTFTAGEIMRDYRDQRQRVLLICPAALRDTTWSKFLNQFQLLVETVSYEQLGNEIQLGGEQHYLKNSLEDYALVVIDESHNYRNPDTPTRAAKLRQLLSGKRRDVVLLTATPVNNSLWDLYHLLRFFMKQDAWLAARGVLSIRERFEQAMNEDPFDLNPDLLYPIIDATTVKRTRRFVKKYYENDLIRGYDGKLTPIHFPKPIASSIKYNLDDILPGFFSRLEEILMPANGRPLLRMAKYQPELYMEGLPHDGERDTALVGLLRSALLKRFESSIYAFNRTLRKMIREHEAFLAALDQGKIVRKEFFKELSAADEEFDIEELIESSDHVEDSGIYDIDLLKSAVNSDLEILREMESTTCCENPTNDPKLKALVRELETIIHEADAEATDNEDSRQKRKVLVFSHYEDTIDWIEDFLVSELSNNEELAQYKDRLASVSGQDSRQGIHREQAIFGFAPNTTGAPPDLNEDTYDLLLCTDVLAEGMNLQQCRNIINFDLPWNPMRLVQRHGRIDRIGSPHNTVYLRTFFPDDRLESLLNLEERVRRKLAQAAASVGVEDAPIEGASAREQSFAETREEIEKLHKEDAAIFENGGTEGAAQTGEEYRQELRKAIEGYGETLENLPWRIGSGMRKGDQSGYFFCASVEERIYLRFIPSNDPNNVLTEIGTCLRLIECSEDTEQIMDVDLALNAYSAWEIAHKDIYDSWMYETDPANMQPKVRKLNREVAQFIRANPPDGVEQVRINRCLDAVESPWSRREENQLRVVWNDHFSSQVEKSLSLIEIIEQIGAEPFKPPEPLPPISFDDIHLICWLAIQPN